MLYYASARNKISVEVGTKCPPRMAVRGGLGEECADSMLFFFQ